MSYRRRTFKDTLAAFLVLAVAAGAAILLWKVGGNIYEYLTRESRYDRVIYEASMRNGIDPALVKAVIWRESKFNMRARGNAGEVGLMQIMPDRAAVDWAKAHKRAVPQKGTLFSPQLNIEIGSWYLGNAVRRWSAYKDCTALALCEYNAGLSRAAAWRPVEKDGDVRPRIAIASTVAYVDDILVRYEKYKKSSFKR